LGLASWRTAYKRLAIGRMLLSFEESERGVLRAAIAEIGLAKASVVAPAIERFGEWKTWLELALQCSMVVLQARVSQALEALPRGREPSPPGESFRRAVLGAMPDIEAYLRSLGDRYLPPQITLRIEILDISLAGRSRQSPRATWPVRSMTGEADWPRFDLRYTLESGGKSSAQVEETVVDRNYLRRLESRYQLLALPYEMRALEEWFKVRFAERLA